MLFVPSICLGAGIPWTGNNKQLIKAVDFFPFANILTSFRIVNGKRDDKIITGKFTHRFAMKKQVALHGVQIAIRFILTVPVRICFA